MLLKVGRKLLLDQRYLLLLSVGAARRQVGELTMEGKSQLSRQLRLSTLVDASA
jgi:hypothetical protein